MGSAGSGSNDALSGRLVCTPYETLGVVLTTFRYFLYIRANRDITMITMPSINSATHPTTIAMIIDGGRVSVMGGCWVNNGGTVSGGGGGINVCGITTLISFETIIG